MLGVHTAIYRSGAGIDPSVDQFSLFDWNAVAQKNFGNDNSAYSMNM